MFGTIGQPAFRAGRSRPRTRGIRMRRASNEAQTSESSPEALLRIGWSDGISWPSCGRFYAAPSFTSTRHGTGPGMPDSPGRRIAPVLLCLLRRCRASVARSTRKALRCRRDSSQANRGADVPELSRRRYVVFAAIPSLLCLILVVGAYLYLSSEDRARKRGPENHPRGVGAQLYRAGPGRPGIRSTQLGLLGCAAEAQGGSSWSFLARAPDPRWTGFARRRCGGLAALRQFGGRSGAGIHPGWQRRIRFLLLANRHDLLLTCSGRISRPPGHRPTSTSSPAGPGRPRRRFGPSSSTSSVSRRMWSCCSTASTT